ncbi:MAG: peptidyl-prolyl cis-trans isomerase [Lachnospiraceae bacterium]|nr:peptidyl-prolyl cis-trans isomerase [Lachnospiraceae bacterium]
MKSMMKRAAIVLVACLSMSSLAGCRIGNTEYILKEKKMKSNVLFTLNDTSCGIEEAKLYLANYRNLYGTSYGIELWDKEYDEASLVKYIKDVTLAEIQRIYAINGMAEAQGITLSESELSTVNEMAEEYYNSLTDDEIKFIGASLKNITTAYQHYALAEKVYKNMTEGVNEEVSDDEARVMEVLMIYVTDRDTATLLAEKLEGSSDFAAIGSSYNENDSLDVFIARGEYPQEVEDVVFSLDDDEESGMIETSEGYYFVKVINKFDEEKTEENIEKIRVQKQKAQFDDSYDAFISEAVYHFNSDVWESISIDSDYELETSTFFSKYQSYMEE